MAGVKKITIHIIVVCLVCILLLGGCSRLKVDGAGRVAGEIESTPVEAERAELLREIDRKFDNPDAHFRLGQLYQADGMWAQAENEYKTALNLEPVHRGAQAARVKVLMDGGDLAKAELLADIYMEQVSSSAVGALRLALAFQRQGLDEYALSCYRQALNLAPNSAKINRQIGYYYLSKNDMAQARSYLSRSFQLNPNQPEVAGELGRLGVSIRIPRKAREDADKLDRIVEQSDEK